MLMNVMEIPRAKITLGKQKNNNHKFNITYFDDLCNNMWLSVGKATKRCKPVNSAKI